MDYRLSIFFISLIFSVSCQSPSSELVSEKNSDSTSIAVPGGEIQTVSYYPLDTVIWFDIEDQAKFLQLISDREELNADAITIGGVPIFQEQADSLIQKFDLEKEPSNGEFSRYVGKDFGLVAKENKSHILAFDQLETVSIDELSLKDMSLEEFKNRFPKAYWVRNFGTRNDSKIILNYPDSIRPSFDHSFLYIEERGELRLFWVEGKLAEAYVIFGQQQKGKF
jgi:hypothetical protein